MKSTLIKILTREKDTVAKAMAEVGMPVKFFTMENNTGLVQCEIECDEPGLMFLFGKICGHAVAMDQVDKM